MNNFVFLTTTKNEKILCNVDKIVYFGQVKEGTIIYFDEFTRYTVKETIDEIFARLIK